MKKLLTKNGIRRGMAKVSFLAIPATTSIIVLSCTRPASADGSPQARQQLDTLFRLSAQRFWGIEPQSDVYQIPDQTIRPLKPGDPKTAAYRRAADTAEAFLRVQARTGKTDWRTPVEKYLDIMSLASLGEHARVASAIDSFLAEYPNYARHRSDTTIAYDHPVRGPLIQLRLYSLARLLVPDSPDASTPPAPPQEESPANPALRPISLPVSRKPAPSQPMALAAVIGRQPVLDFLKDATEQAATAITAQNAAYERKDMAAFMADSTQQPDELRARALPDTLVTLIALHEKLLPEALKTVGGKAVRDYLRKMAMISVSDSNGIQKPFFGYANHKLQSIDHDILAQYQGEAEKAIAQKRWADARKWLGLIVSEYPGTDAATSAKKRIDFVMIAEYRDDAQKAMDAHQFADARAFYKKIIAEFPDTSDAAQAQDDIKKTVPIAVTYYRDQGQSNFRAANEYGIPQVASTSFYEKMYAETGATGEQADIALFGWSEGLATEGKFDQATSQLKDLINRFPQSECRPKAMFLVGFIYGSQHVRNYAEAIKWMNQVIAAYPDSPQAPEALWHAAFYYSWLNGQYDKGLPYLEKLQASYPSSPRWKYTDEWINIFLKRKG